MAVTKIANVVKPDVLAKYIINRTAEKSALFQSGILSPLNEASALGAQGGSYIALPFWSDLTGESDVLSDTDVLPVNNIAAEKDIAVLHTRGKAWGANDLAIALSGDDPMGAIGELAADFWARNHQKMLIASLKGALGASTMTANVHDISAGAAGAAVIGAEAFIDASYKLGDSVDKLTAVAMHSSVMAVLAKQGLIETVRDADGVILYKTYMDKRIIVDDGITADAGVYTTYLFGEGAVGYQEIAPPVAVETDRDSLAGNDILINRRHFILHPRGIKWAGSTGASPTTSALSTTTNWAKVYDHKQIRLVAFKHKIA